MDWKGIVGAVAPALATVLGGPLAGVAVKALSSKLLGRDDGSEADIAQAVASMSPADLIKLKEVEAELTKSLAEVDVDLERVAAGDRDSARRRAVEMRDWTPNVLAFCLLGLFAYVLHSLMTGGEQSLGRDIMMMMIGGLIANNQQAQNYFFGTTRSSASKDKTLAGLVKSP